MKKAFCRWTEKAVGVVLICGLGQADSARGASISASATLGALIGIDAIDIAFRDSANGAFVDTGAASNAVFTNYVSHGVE